MTIDEVIAKNLDLFIDDVKKRHISAGQRVTGKTIDSLKRKSIGINHQVIEGNEYIGVLETGRKGGKIPRDFINILRNWANAKGITFEDDKKATSWLKYQGQYRATLHLKYQNLHLKTMNPHEYYDWPFVTVRALAPN